MAQQSRPFSTLQSTVASRRTVLQGVFALGGAAVLAPDARQLRAVDHEQRQDRGHDRECGQPADDDA